MVVAIAVLLHAALGITVSVSGLIMPTGAVMVLGLVWIVGVAAMIWCRRRPVPMLAVPIATWAVWFIVVGVGETWLGWTA